MNKEQFKAFETDILSLTEQRALRGGGDGYETCSYTQTGSRASISLGSIGEIVLYDDSDVEESPDWVCD